MTRYAIWLDAHPRLAWLAVVAMTALAAFGATRVEFDVNLRNLFRSDDRRMEVLEELYRDFGSDDFDCVVLLRSEDMTAPAAAEAVGEIARRARTLPEVETVRTPLAHPAVAARLVSADRRSALILVRLVDTVDYLSYLDGGQCTLRRAVAESVEGTGVTAVLTGVPVIRAEILGTMQREQIRFMSFGSIAGAIIALLLFRSVVATVVVCTGALAGGLWTIGFFGLAGEPINPVNSAIPTLVLVVGLTDAVHLMHEFRVRRRNGTAVRDAARETLRVVGPACALTSLTTAIGFASLAAARIDVIERFGLAAAAGSVLTFAAVVSVVPLLVRTNLGGRAGMARSRHHADGGFIGFLLARARPVAVAGVFVTVLLAAASTQLVPSSSLQEGLPGRSPAAGAVRIIDGEFGGLMELIVRVEWDATMTLEHPVVLDTLARVHAVLESEALVGAPFSVLTVLGAVGGDDEPARKVRLLSRAPPGIVKRVVRPDLRRAVVTAPVPDSGTHVHAPVLDRLRTRLEAIDAETPLVKLVLSGTPVAVGRSADFMIEDLAVSLAIAAGVILVVMIVAFRSIVLGLVSLVPNVFPLVSAGALLVVTGRPLTITGVITFVVCLGIAVDDTIHVLTRVRRGVAGGLTVPDAVADALRSVGAALITTTAVLIGGFGTVLFSEMPMLSLFGELCCVALIAALVGDLVILPALLAVLLKGTTTPRAGRIPPGATTGPRRP
ncbi:MAG: MMPL family transporter [Planctomycetes bacterium]|nr:MMPL family transporter [Planctomycetota bacterium]